MGGAKDGVDGPLGRSVRDRDAASAKQLPFDRRGEPTLRPGPVAATERDEEVRPVPEGRARLRERPLPRGAGGQLPGASGSGRAGALAWGRRRGGGGAGGEGGDGPGRQRGQDAPEQAEWPALSASAGHARPAPI